MMIGKSHQILKAISLVIILLEFTPIVMMAQTTIFSESMGTVGGTTTIAAHETANGFDNDGYTMTQGGIASPGDIRVTSPSAGYAGASGLANVWLTNTAGSYGFAIEGIDASAYTSLTVQFGYRKELAGSLPTLALDYWDGASWINVPFAFNEVAGAAVGWYLSPIISLPVGAQISGLKLRWVKSGGIQCRLDDIILKGTSAVVPTITVNPVSLSGFTYVQGLGPSASQSYNISGINLTGAPGNLTVTGSTNYEVSLNNITFTPSVNVSYATATLTATPVYVRLKVGLTAGTYNSETILNAGGGAAVSPSVTCNGTVTAPTSACGNEGFNSFDSGVRSPGWVFTGFTNASVYTSATNYGISSPALKFDATGDIVETAVVNTPSQLSFWIKGQGTDATSALLVEGWNGAVWTTVANIVPLPTSPTTKTYTAGLTTFTKFRFTYTKSAGNLAFDDVNVICGAYIITTGVVTGSPFSVNCSAGASGTVAFTSVGTYTVSNTYTAQLSDATGSFALPVDIGTLVSSANSGTINITIPANTAAGAGYLIRVISNGPAVTGSSSAAFTINNAAPCTITPGVITGAPFNVTCTATASGTIAFTSTATYTANTYTAQLSNAAGSFALPTNIGSLISNANSGTINITIPAGIPSGAGYQIRIISNSPTVIGSASAASTVNLTGGPCSVFEIESILVDACDGGTGLEGVNEMVRFVVGSTALNTADIIVTWPNNPWLGICQNATTAATVAAINATITGGGMLIEPTGGVLPAGAQVLFFTSTGFNYTLFDFTNLNYTVYAIFQCPGNTAGHFVNHQTSYTPRTLTITFTGHGSDAVTYDAHLVYNGDGGAVDFDAPGNPTYGTTGGCYAPIFPLPIELINFTAVYQSGVVELNWITSSEINNDYFTLERSQNADSFIPILQVPGAGNSNSIRNYRALDKNPFTGLSYYRLKQTDYDGAFSYSKIIPVMVSTSGSLEIISTTSDENLINIFIYSENASMLNIDVTNLLGKTIISCRKEKTEGTQMITINKDNIAKGLYLMRVSDGQIVVVKKICL